MVYIGVRGVYLNPCGVSYTGFVSQCKAVLERAAGAAVLEGLMNFSGSR